MAKKKNQDSVEPEVKSWRDVLKEDGLAFQTAGVEEEFLPTKFESLQRILNTKGIPAGYVVELYGDRGQGKTNFGLDYLKQFQDTYGTNEFYALVVDTEGAVDRPFLELHGIDPDAVVYVYEPVLEFAFKKIIEHLKTGRCKFLLVDSIGQLQQANRSALLKTNSNKFDYEASGERVRPQTPGEFARSMQDGVKDIAALIKIHRVFGFFTNQIRMKVGGYGNPETTPGGKLFEHTTHFRLKFTGGKSIYQGNKETGLKIGHQCNCEVTRNRFNGRIGKTIDKECFEFYFEGGPRRYQLIQAYNALARASVIQLAGTWIKVIDPDTGEVVKQWQGRAKFDEDMLADEEKFDWLMELASRYEQPDTGPT